MTEAQDRHALLEALSRIHKFSPLRAVQPQTSEKDAPPAGGSAGSVARGQGRRSGGILLRLFEREVFRW